MLQAKCPVLVCYATKCDETLNLKHEAVCRRQSVIAFPVFLVLHPFSARDFPCSFSGASKENEQFVYHDSNRLDSLQAQGQQGLTKKKRKKNKESPSENVGKVERKLLC